VTLRRKLVLALSALALLAAVIAGVTLWSGEQRESADARLEGHYRRSLLVQRVRATTFRAVREVPDAIAGRDRGAASDFERQLRPAESDFRQWADLADTRAERDEVTRVRAAYASLVADARRVFTLTADGRVAAARRLSEGRLENGRLPAFERLTDAAVAEDRRKRQVIRADAAGVKRTGQLVLLIAAFGTVSLIMLLFAYVSSDLFGPLRRLSAALDDVGRGDLRRRLPEDRRDELGAAAAAFNRMVAALEVRERASAVAPGGTGGGDGDLEEPSRILLHRLVARARARLARLDGDSSESARAEAAAELDALMHTVSRVTELGFPLDLSLERTDVRAMLYEVLLRFQDDYVARGVSLEVDIDPAVRHAVVDRLKLREVLSEVVRNAVASLPDEDGRLGLRASVTSGGDELVIDVADNGEGIEEPDAVLSGGGLERLPARGTGLAFTREIVARHGGAVTLTSDRGGGTLVRIRLPLRDESASRRGGNR
jgi:two-component system, OmpR family, sensor kinase